MKLYLSTGSQLKHDVVKAAFADIGHDVDTVAVPVESGVNDQPMSMEETYLGAANRHQAMKESIGAIAAGDCMVTIESGIYIPVKQRGTYFGTQAIIVEHNGDTHLGIDSDIEFPKVMTDRIPSDYPDLGALVRAEYGATENDPLQVFTNGQRSRRYYMQQALTNVLIQFKEFATLDESK